MIACATEAEQAHSDPTTLLSLPSPVERCQSPHYNFLTEQDKKDIFISVAFSINIYIQIISEEP